MSSDHKVTTWAGKQVHLDRDYMLTQVEGEPEYYFFCLSPQSRWLAVSLINFFAEYHNRWDGWSGPRQIDQLVAETLEGLFCQMACAEDIQAIGATLTAMNVILGQIRDRLGGGSADLDVRLSEIKTEVEDLDATLVDFGLPELIDKIEPMLNGVGVILGAPQISSNGS